MTRRCIGLLITLALGLLLAPLAADAQPSTNVHRIGLLVVGSPLAARANVEAFRQGLRALGYVEGQNLAIEYRYDEGKAERLPELAAELVALQVDVIVAAAGTLVALAAQRATQTLPIVFIAVGDPVTSGLVASLARPGGNMTGSSSLSPELGGKCLEYLKQAVPGVSRVAVLLQPGAIPARTYTDILAEANAAARALGVQLHVAEVRGPEDFSRAFATMIEARAGALVVLSTPMLYIERSRLVALTAQHRLPTVFSFREYVDAGGLLSYGPNIADLFRRAATYVDKILKGAKPADLPVEQPTTFELVINLKTAQALGLTMPPTLLFQADEIIR